MKTALASAVHPILQHGIALCARRDADQPIAWQQELVELRRLFMPLNPERLHDDMFEEFDFDVATGNASEEQDRLTRRTVRYALACWLDDLLQPTSAPHLRERLFEAELIGSSEGAGKFWEEARYAETRGDVDALEVMHLCVLLGFRGEWRRQPLEVEAWAQRVGRRLDSAPPSWTMPASLEPSLTSAPASTGLPSRRLAFSLLASPTLLVPAAVVLWWRHWPS